MILKKKIEVDLMYDEHDLFGKSPNEDFQYFCNLLLKHNPEANIQFLRKAFAICCFYHRTDIRKSGKPYYTHPLWVAIILIENFKIYDEIYLAAAFLHDTIEDTAKKTDKVYRQTIIEKTGDEYLAEIVEALTKISHEKLIIENESFREQLIKKHSEEKVEALLKNKQIQKCFTHRKLFQTFVKDQNIIIIKLADRLHNMKTLHYMYNPQNPEKSDRKMKEIAEETLEFYVRFATRLGFSYVAEELQNLSFYFKSDRDLYPKIREAIESKESFIMERLKFYEMDINKSFENTEFSSTTIHLYHRKEYEIYTLTNQFQNIDKLPDFVTCIIAVPVSENYELRKAASQLINQFGHSNVSNYQEGKKHLGEYEFDTIQIRVKKPELDNLDITIMSGYDHDILENFVNVPIKEKRIKKKVEGITAEQLELWSDWMELVILEKGENAIKDIWDSLDKNLFEEKILCFSVDQKAVYLPRGSTVLDFAFALSPDTGIHFNGARIQENVFDVYYKLSGNETIQILKSKKITASPEWRNFISDYRALGYFFNFLKNREFNSSELGISEKPTIIPLPEIQNIYLTLKQGFTGKIIIKGNDRKHLLKDISKAIGDSEIRKSTIQGSDTSKQFEGVFEVHFENAKSCNHVIMQLLNIRNVKSAELVKINLN